jgi:exodeoxyribonuclease V alpha subunit
MITEIEQAIARSDLDHFDRYFVRTLQRLHGEGDHLVLYLAALARKAVSLGHVCLDLAGLAGQRRGEGESPWPDLEGLVALLAASPLVAGSGDDPCPLLLEGSRLYLQRYWRYEEELAGLILERARRGRADVEEERLDRCLSLLFPAASEADPQRAACAAVFRQRLGIVTGGPGTGKTTLIANLLALYLLYAGESSSPPPVILLLAPTGKAAARLSESLTQRRQHLPLSPDLLALLPARALTVHRALGYLARTPTMFRHNMENPMPADLVVVDEASMVDVALMAKLLAAVAPSAAVVLVGDSEQLASVEAGSILGDICAAAEQGSGKGGRLAHTVVRLRESHRFSGQSGIGAMAAAVNSGEAAAAIALCSKGEGGIRLLPPWEGEHGDHPLAALVLDGYRDFLRADNPLTALELFRAFRLLSAHRTGPVGVERLNVFVERVLGKNRLIRPTGPWYRGRPLLIGTNSYRLGLYNGDIGMVWPGEGGSLQAFFPAVEGGGVRAFPLLQLPPHETAFAMTIHKSQGSEFDRVALLLPPEDSPLLSRELLYTGITRARQQVVLIGREQEISTAIGRRAERASGLREKLVRGQ